jgi:hypothetical protein
MLLNALRVAHIAVLGYWLGAELVINSTYRYVSWSAGMPFDERDRLMDHVMDVDQHVRYALILQAGLGTVLAALLGYLPGGTALAIGAAVIAAAWLALTEAAHRLRRSPAGKLVATGDRGVRYAAVAALLVLWASVLAGVVALPPWFAWKLLMFAGVIACGIGIRGQLMRFYVTWRRIAADGSSARLERDIRRTYVAATSILVTLWLFIAGMVLLSVYKT